MIRIPKKQSSDYPFLPLLVYLIFLVSFFFYSAKVRPDFFIVLAIAQLCILAVAIPAHFSLLRKRDEINFLKQDTREKTNLLQVDIAHEQMLTGSLQKKIVKYSQLKDLTEQLSKCLSVSDTSNTLLAMVDGFFDDPDFTKILYLFHVKTGELGISSSYKGSEKINIKTKKGDIFDGWLTQKMQPLLVEDARKDFRFDAEKVTPDNDRTVHSLMSVPLSIGNKTIGILRIDSPFENSFSTDDLRFFTTVGDLAAVALENAQLYQHVEELAIKDGLTGLYLRRYLLERMSGEITRHLRRKKELSVLMIDLDKFKQYNDAYGHVAGDIVLKLIGKDLQEFFKETGSLVSRYGGEEFVVLLPEVSREEAVELAENFRKAVEKKEIVLRQKKTRMTVSIGVATFPRDAQIKEELLEAVDNAMYAAKGKGRNKVCAVG